MAEPPEFWTFLLTNLVIFCFGAVLTGLSFYAYLASDGRRSFRTSTVGFGSITLGGLVDPVYQLGVKGGYDMANRELLALQTVEGLFVGLGLGLLFLAIYRHDRTRRRTEVENLQNPSGPR